MKQKAPVVLFLLLLFAACSKNTSEQAGSGHQANAATVDYPGQSIYKQYCKLCHGNQGNLGLSGAANLKKSSLTLEERIDVITNGRNGMTAHKTILTPEEINSVAKYIELLHD